MSEIINDKVDKFHEALISRLYTKKALVVIAMGIVLFAYWYVSATYEEFDWDFREGELYLYREIETVTCPCGRRDEYVSFSMGTFVPAPEPGSWPWPHQWNCSVENMTSWTEDPWFMRNKVDTCQLCANVPVFKHYREVAWLARARLFNIKHIKRVMGRTLTEEHVRYKLTIDYYQALLSYDLGINATREEVLEPESISGGYLWPTAAQKFAELYYRLKMVEVGHRIWLRP